MRGCAFFLQRAAEFSEGMGNELNLMNILYPFAQRTVPRQTLIMKHRVAGAKTLFLIGAYLVASAISASADWVAGRDLTANELPNGNGVELIDPNPTVPEWSYGYRGSLTGTSLTLFTASDHTNSDGGNTSVQGFNAGGVTPTVSVNVGASDVVFNFGFGNLNPLHPEEMKIHPGPSASNSFSIVRWIAPASGTYLVSAYWTDLDPNGTQFGGVNGATGAITINGSVIFDVDFANNSGTQTGTLTETFNAGDIVDFLTGSQGDYRFDDTGFDATVVAVPEPATASSLVIGTILVGTSFYFRRRQRNR
jgi:hypothetical protein